MLSSSRLLNPLTLPTQHKRDVHSSISVCSSGIPAKVCYQWRKERQRDPFTCMGKHQMTNPLPDETPIIIPYGFRHS